MLTSNITPENALDEKLLQILSLFSQCILRMPIPHQVSHRVLTCHNTLVIRKDHAAALIARFPVCQKSLDVKTVLTA